MHDPPFDDMLPETFDIPATQQQHDDTAAVSNPFETPEPTIDPSLLAPLGPGYDGACLDSFHQDRSVLVNPEWPEFEHLPESTTDWAEPPQGDNSIEVVSLAGFLHENGAWWPPIPCSHCRRLRLQCFILQTTSHNPNPIRSCSSCVALFRDCSLAEQGKRQASYFETPQPVIGHLHGITDEELILSPDDFSKPQVTDAHVPSQIGNKRSYSRSVHKTQPLRSWFSAHMDNPYPSEEEKVRLMEQSGLSRTQVIDWFTNARRRHRLSSRSSSSRKIFRQGSPMPSPPLASMSPLERWRNSPPDEEPVSALAIENALRESLGTTSPLPLEPTSTSTKAAAAAVRKRHSRSSSLDDNNNSIANTSSPGLYPTSISDSASASSSCYSLSSASSSPRGVSLFPCAGCARSFKKRSDLRRHRASVHGAGGGVSWTCGLPLRGGTRLTVWRAGRRRPECVLCGREEEEGGDTDAQHFQTHEFEACGRRPVADRTFARKDHLWQHLYKFHGCRKWEGWVPDLKVLQRGGP
ncbi:hypothetical protein F4775DRAFT_335306 [Biscogniauxia sp. FL1348]|nr:hypothetical protein F4775DRAFT_335306 [Biscogniauxia sp. FL1348]